MSRLKVSISMSLDGYTAGPEQSVENPLGIRGEELHDWVVRLRAFNEMNGREGGDEGPSNAVVESRVENIGATVMGRNMFGGGPGPWGADRWDGWWGQNPPYHHPVFILTHYEREPLEMDGGTTYHFVTDGIESALEQARTAAGDQDVMLAGGANTVQQYLAAGLLDEILVSVVPLFLGDGTLLFDNLGDARPRLELVETVVAPDVTHTRYRVG